MENKIALLVLNYNGFEKTYNCINSCLKQKNTDMTIVLIDNSSTDYSFIRLKHEFKDQIEYLLLDKNWGYAGGNNRAIKIYFEKGYKYSFILNNDIVLIGVNLVNFLHEIILEHENCAIVAPTIYNIISKGKEKLLNTSGYLKMLDYFGVVKQRKIPLSKQLIQINEAHGSALFVDNSIFLKAGGFPEENFMYGDESAYAKKIINLGYNILQFNAEDNYVEHHHDKTKDIDLWRLYLMGRNKVLETRYFDNKKALIWKLCMEISLIYTWLRMTKSNDRKAYFGGVKKGKKLLRTNASKYEIFEDAKASVDQFR